MSKPSQLSLQEARDLHELATLQLETVTAQTKAALLQEHARPLLESYDVPPSRYDEWAFTDPVDGYSRPRVRSRTLRRDHSRGRYFPAYETEVDLARMRMDARLLATFDTVATGALGSLTNYVIGSGVDVEVIPREGVEPPAELVEEVRRFVDEFLQDNKLSGELDREIHEQSRIDGDLLLEVYGEGPHVLLDIREPEEITEPMGKRALEDWLYATNQLPHNVVPDWSFGVLTDECRCHRPVGYHVVRDDAGTDWDFIPAARGVHIKRNVGRRGKRGVTDFLAPGPDINGHNRIKTNVSTGAAIQAAIAYIREHVPGQRKSDIEAFIAANATAEYQRASKDTTRTVQVEQFRPGTVKDVPAGFKYLAGPLGSLNHPVFLEIAQHVLRIAGINWGMPEYMISGDASNANFASTLVAESPFVKAREADQGFYSRRFEEVLWKAVRVAVGFGRFGAVDFETIWRLLTISVILPEVASRDKLQQAQTNEILLRNGILSRKTWAIQADLDFDEEQRQGARPAGMLESDYRRNFGGLYP